MTASVDEEAESFFATFDRGAVDEAAAFHGVKPKRKRRPLRFHTRNQLKALAPTQYIVENVWVEQGLNLVWGPYGSYKSFHVIDVCAHIATGLPWMGLVTKRKRVVYIAPEGGSGINQRLSAWEQHHKHSVSDDYWITLPSSVSFIDDEAVDQFIAELKALFASLSVDPDGVVVVIDTYARCLAGGDENSARDACLALEAYERLRDELGATIVIVHHSGKDTSKGARGAIALPSGVDTEWSLEVQQAMGSVLLTNLKQKDRAKLTPTSLVPVPIYGSVVMQPAAPQMQSTAPRHVQGVQGNRFAKDQSTGGFGAPNPF